MNRPYSFADRLKTLMEKRSLTRSAIARICEIDKSNITRYCNGTYEAKQDVIYRMAAKLNVSEAWLMGYDVPMERQKHPLQSSSLEPKLTPEEIQIIELYRRADQIDRNTILNILSRYDEERSLSQSSVG